LIDVEGSTVLTDRMGDAAALDVLRKHERITREALKAHGGSELKTMGDGFMASFGSATKALDCAVAVQRAFATAISASALASTPASRSPKTTRAGAAISSAPPSSSPGGSPLERMAERYSSRTSCDSSSRARAFFQRPRRPRTKGV
jgi:class 3 adenylate cyclase